MGYGAKKMDKKHCIRCKEIKDLSLFHKNKRTPDGYRYCCKDCAKIYEIERKKKTTKLCPTCNEIKNVTEFYTQVQTRTGYQTNCKDCSRTRQKQYYIASCKKPILKNEYDKPCKKAHPLAFNQFFMNVKGIGINA